MDLYFGLDCKEQKTPHESRDIGLIRVTHPHHPLYNQIVKALRFAGHPAYPDLRYLIELPDGSCAELPVSWAVAVPEVDPTPGSTTPVEHWAGVSELLALAHLVQEISSTLSIAE